MIARFNHEVVLSGQEAEAVSERLMAMLKDRGRRQLLVDFGNVKSLSSLMLGKLVQLNRVADSGGVKLALFNLRPDVHGILEVTRLTLILRVYGTEEEALQGMTH